MLFICSAVMIGFVSWSDAAKDAKKYTCIQEVVSVYSKQNPVNYDFVGVDKMAKEVCK
jgi:hypothetical protein